MNYGEQEPGIAEETDNYETDDFGAAEGYYEAPPRGREASWLYLWRSRDFTWLGRSRKPALQTKIAVVPSSFPDGRESEGEFKKVSLQDYWRWSIGLPGEERLLTDAEMKEAGLLVEVDGETYHLIHAPDMAMKVDKHGISIQILKDIVAARSMHVPEDIGIGAYGIPKFARALQLKGGWLPGELLQNTGTETAIDMSGARVSDINLARRKVGHLHCYGSLFKGKATFDTVNFNGVALFDSATFADCACFLGSTFSRGANFSSATFKAEADFGHCAFIGDAYFGQSTLSGNANFTGSAFNCAANFGDVTFGGEVRFDGATFKSESIFEDATFSGETTFTDVTFSGEADFGAANFEGSLTFDKCTFECDVCFLEVNWSTQDRPNAFKATRFKDFADFRSEHPISVSAFNEAHFDTLPSFDDSDTPKQLRRFYRNSVIRTEGSMRLARKKQSLAEQKEEPLGRPTPDQLLAALEGGFRTLRKAADRNGNFPVYQTSYRFEIRTRMRRPKIALWNKVASKLYGLSSDYGNSFVRPVLSLAVIFFSFALLYLALAIELNLVDLRDRSALQSGFLESLDFSLKSSLQPLSALSTDAPREGDANSFSGKLLNKDAKAFGVIVTAMSIVQLLTWIVLACLFGLGLWRRLRISRVGTQ